MSSQGKARPELLAPAGSHDALVAAINNGADAVYLGLGELNARRGAANFDLASLAEATRFAHLRDARVYLTANVVVLPDEMARALDMVDAAWAAGVDAVIVQDLGLVRVVHEVLPHVRLHASTQIDAMNPETIRVLGDMGVARVVLARESTLEGIAACAEAGLEVETFVHGALCYSYSGQCLMSSLVGRRSANRGMCAQPCRLPYELVAPDGALSQAPGRYLLSPRDLAAIAHLPRFIDAGVAALKIEGRMKSPEYVAVVTGVYRAALDRAWASPDEYEVSETEWEMLAEAFNRGFTDAYLTGVGGPELMSYSRPNNRGVLIGRVASAQGTRAQVQLERALATEDTIEIWTKSGRFAQPAGALSSSGGRPVAVAAAGQQAEITVERPVVRGDRVFRVANAALLDAARRTFTGHAVADARSAPVDFVVRLRIGEPAILAATARGARAEVVGPEVEAARTKPISVDAVIEHIGRLGGSGYRVGTFDIDLDSEAGIGYSMLHALRRDVLERLDKMRLSAWDQRRPMHPALPTVDVSAGPRGQGAARQSNSRGVCASMRSHVSASGVPLLVATVWDIETGEACLDAGADDVMVRVFGAARDETLPAGMRPLLPRVAWPAEVRDHVSWGERLPVVSGNLGTLAVAARNGSAEADWPLNIMNAYGAAALASLGVGLVWASPELSGRQLATLVKDSPVPVGCLVWGRTELMVAEQCVLQASAQCVRNCAKCPTRRGWWHLRDRRGYEFPITTDAAGRSHVLNAVTLDLTRALDEILAMDVAAVRMDFGDEKPARAAEVVGAMRARVAAVAAGAPPPTTPLVQPSTSGHFYRGVL